MSTKIDSIYLGRMPNGAHFTYMELTIERIEEDETVKAKIAAELATLKSAFQVEDDCLKISQKNALTNRIDSADTRRDGYYSGYKGTVKGFLKLPAGEMLDAAQDLDQHMTDYKIDTRAQLDRQTGMMTNFIADLETRFATQVELLGLGTFVTNMKEANDEVRALLKQQIDAGSEEEEDREKLFTSMEELQATNQRLLEKIHGLEVERAEPQALTEEENAKIAQLEKEVESINALRKEQEALMATITKQRDMYRVLLSQKDAETVSGETPSVLQSTHLELKRQMEETQSKLSSQLERSEAMCSELRQSAKSAEEQLNRTTELLRVEKQCGEQKDDMVRRLQASLDTMQLQIRKLEQENTSLQSSLAAKQKDLDQERLKVRFEGQNNA